MGIVVAFRAYSQAVVIDVEFATLFPQSNASSERMPESRVYVSQQVKLMNILTGWLFRNSVTS